MCSKLPPVPELSSVYVCVYVFLSACPCVHMCMCSCVRAHLCMRVLETKDQYQVSFLRSHPSYF